MIALGFLLGVLVCGPVIGLVCFFAGRHSAVHHELADIGPALRRSK